MKYIIILGDGMADYPVSWLGYKTLLQYAHTPFMDELAQKGRCGMLTTVPHGFPAGSEVANLSILGYDIPSVYEGRGAWEAAGMGVDLQTGDVAFRCNLVCWTDGVLTSHSAGQISTEEAHILIDELILHLSSTRIQIYKGVSHRFLLVIKGGSKAVRNPAPHDSLQKPYGTHLFTPITNEAKATSALLNDVMERANALLTHHPLQQKRISDGKLPANGIWLWGGGTRPPMLPLSAYFPQIKRASVISAVDVIRGIGVYAGMRPILVEGATGFYNTNYEQKVAAALKALETDDLVYLHIEASDEAGHEGDVKLKLRTIEDLDSRVVRPVYKAVRQWDEPITIAVLPDHPTPCALRTHTSDAVPFLIYRPDSTPDAVQTFDEQSALCGSYGTLEKDKFIRALLQAEKNDPFI